MKPVILTTGLFSAGLATASFAGIVRRDNSSIQISDCLNSKNVPTQWQDSPDYAELAEPFNTRLAYKPYAIVMPETNQHVQDAVACANQCGIKVSCPCVHYYFSFGF
jgi:hypothetical protein